MGPGPRYANMQSTDCPPPAAGGACRRRARGGRGIEGGRRRRRRRPLRRLYVRVPGPPRRKPRECPAQRPLCPRPSHTIGGSGGGGAGTCLSGGGGGGGEGVQGGGPPPVGMKIKASPWGRGGRVVQHRIDVALSAPLTAFQRATNADEGGGGGGWGGSRGTSRALAPAAERAPCATLSGGYFFFWSSGAHTASLGPARGGLTVCVASTSPTM